MSYNTASNALHCIWSCKVCMPKFFCIKLTIHCSQADLKDRSLEVYSYWLWRKLPACADHTIDCSSSVIFYGSPLCCRDVLVPTSFISVTLSNEDISPYDLLAWCKPITEPHWKRIIPWEQLMFSQMFVEEWQRRWLKHPFSWFGWLKHWWVLLPIYSIWVIYFLAVLLSLTVIS